MIILFVVKIHELLFQKFNISLMDHELVDDSMLRHSACSLGVWLTWHDVEASGFRSMI